MKLVVHEFNMGDVDDPELYAAFPISEFERTDKGVWLHQHSTEQMWYNIGLCPNTYGYKCTIWANLNEDDTVYYKLKYE